MDWVEEIRNHQYADKWGAIDYEQAGKCIGDMSRLISEIERLRKDFKRYGTHSPCCTRIDKNKCKCGLLQALKEGK